MMRLKKQIMILLGSVLICLLAQDYDRYMNVWALSQQIDLSGD